MSSLLKTSSRRLLDICYILVLFSPLPYFSLASQIDLVSGATVVFYNGQYLAMNTRSLFPLLIGWDADRWAYLLLILCFSNYSDVHSWVLNCHCFLSTLEMDAKWTSRSLCFLYFTRMSYFGYFFDVSTFDASVGQLRTGQRIFVLSFLFLSSLWRISAPFFLVLLLLFFFSCQVDEGLVCEWFLPGCGWELGRDRWL